MRLATSSVGRFILKKQSLAACLSLLGRGRGVQGASGFFPYSGALRRLTVCPRGSTIWASCGGEGGFLEHVRVTAGFFGRILGRGGGRLPRRTQAL